MTDLPIVGAAMTIEEIEAYRDWLLEKPRDLEIQDFSRADVLEGDWALLVDRARLLLDGHTGRLGIHGPFWGITIDSSDPDVRAVVIKRMNQGLDACEALGATQMVIHSPYTTWDYNNLDNYEGAREKMIELCHLTLDVIFPSVTNGNNYYPDDLLQPLDEGRLELGNLIESMLRDSVTLGGTYRGDRMLLPFDWGTEAVTFDSSVVDLADDQVSFGSLWTSEAVGKAAFRQKSVIMGVGLYLDSIGELKSDRMLDVYKSEDDARRVWDACAQFVIDNKQNIAAFWNNATEATNSFKQAGASIGRTWDTTGLLLNREDAKWKYRMPIEGGITWMDSMGVPLGAENLDQAYAFINAMLDPEMAGMFSANTGYNSAVNGAADFAGDDYKKQFNAVYNADNLGKLWWWQADTPWFAPLRQEYVDRITNA